MKAAVLLAALVTSANAASADDLPYAKQNCDAVIRSPAALHDCFAANLSAANETLERVYRSLMAQSTFYVGSRDRLRDVERVWIEYKDKECAYEYGVGAIRNEDYWLAHAGCKIRMTEQRIRELEGRPSCTGGDSLCTPHMR